MPEETSMGVRIKFHKGAWWIFINRDGRRRAKKIGDKETARRVAQRIREQLAAGVFNLPPAATEQTLGTYAKTWLAGLTGNLKASTIRFYGSNLERYVLPMLGQRALTAVTRADARELIIASRKKGLKLNTVKGIARTLSAVLSQAVEDEKIPANPTLRLGRHLRRGDEPKREVEPLTREEATYLVAITGEHFPRWHPWILLTLRTGLRLGEQIACSGLISTGTAASSSSSGIWFAGCSRRRSRTSVGASICRRSSSPRCSSGVASSAPGG
jgi:integrase